VSAAWSVGWLVRRTGGEADALRAFDRSRFVIEGAALRKYGRWNLVASGEVILRKRDF
jgi:hypothetical protein